MEFEANLLIFYEDNKLIMKTFSLDDSVLNHWGVTKLGILLTKLTEESETGDVLKRTNDFTLSFGKFVLVFHNPKECQEFFKEYVDTLTTDVFDENGVRITREEDFKRNLIIKDDDEDSSDQEITDSNHNEFCTKNDDRITFENNPNDNDEIRKNKIHNFVGKIPH